MWPRLRKQIGVELEQLHKLIEVHRSLIDKCETATPTDIELSALAAMLHSFYSGIENIFKRICIEPGETLPGGASWHRDLLDLMSAPSDLRSAVISPELKRRLEEYLKFRHFFRQAYSFQFDWAKVSSLVLGCEYVLRKLDHELETFLRAGEQTP